MRRWIAATLALLGGFLMAGSIHAETVPPLPELRFSQIPAEHREHYQGDRFSYMEAGSPTAPPLVLLHGVGANSMHWRFQFAGLSDIRRVVAWNAPGYMLSDNLMVEVPECQTFADALADFLASVNIDKTEILANSFGTRVAQCFAHHYPGRVTKMVLTGSATGRKDLPDAERGEILVRREKQVAEGGYGFGERVAALLSKSAKPETIALVKEVLRATNPFGFLQAVRFGLTQMYTPDFKAELAMPILLIQGAEDQVNPTETNAAILAKELPNARLEVLEGAGHLPEVELPDTVNAMVRAFLTK